MATITCASPTDTHAFGQRLGQAAERGEIYTLSGPLGAGKTHLVKGFALGLGYQGEVTSPTFALLHEYHGGRYSLYHFDLYRLSDPRESLRLGLDDYLEGDGLCLIEWPERLSQLMPPSAKTLQITIVNETERRILTNFQC
jgi:tRNA threonylcarbamoyladenosine biosynthesis protein TsaE